MRDLLLCDGLQLFRFVDIQLSEPVILLYQELNLLFQLFELRELTVDLRKVLNLLLLELYKFSHFRALLVFLLEHLFTLLDLVV